MKFWKSFTSGSESRNFYRIFNTAGQDSGLYEGRCSGEMKSAYVGIRLTVKKQTYSPDTSIIYLETDTVSTAHRGNN